MTKSARKTGRPAEIAEGALRQLIRSGVPVALRAVLDSDVYVLDAEISGTTMRLQNARGDFRTFSSLDTVANVVAGLGAQEFTTAVVPGRR